MRFIDAHTHPGFSSPLFEETAGGNGIDYTLDGFLREMKDLGVEKAVGIGWDMASNRFISGISQETGKIIPVFGIRTGEFSAYMRAAERGIKDGEFVGLKILLGYEPVYPNSKMLAPVYRLAEKYGVPVIFHTGDTWSMLNKRAKVMYAHPLKIDDVATDHPDVRIVIAHSGNPWTEDVAEIIYKNENCYADISGWFLDEVKSGYGAVMAAKLRYMVSFAGSKKLMFGSDWPLITMKAYADFLNSVGLGKQELGDLAYENARRFWGVK